jgi:hypothetical protein
MEAGIKLRWGLGGYGSAWRGGKKKKLKRIKARRWGGLYIK